MFPEAKDPDYLDRINDGLPSKLEFTIVVEEVIINEHYKVKNKKNWTTGERIEVFKDVKVMNILHNNLDAVMSNWIIGCKTTKEICDAEKVQCQRTQDIKKNKKSILIQEYEYFDYKPGKSFTDIYDRFLALLNELALVEYFNTKFMRAFSEEWDMKTTVTRDNLNLNETSLIKSMKDL